MDTLKKAREEKGIKQKAVAEHLGVARQTYASYEKNQGMMSIDDALAACEYIGVDVDSIFFAGRR